MMSIILKPKPILILIIVTMILPFLTDSPMTMRILIEIGIFSIIVLGLNLLMGLAGQISMGHAGIFGLSAYITGILSSGKIPGLHVPVYISIPTAIFMTTVLSYIIAKPILKLKGHYLAMGTLSIGIICYTVFVNLPYGGGYDGFGNIPRLWIFGETIAKNKLGLDKYLNGYIITFSILFFLLWLSANIRNSKAGRAFMAIHTSETAAASLGIDVSKYKVLVFTLSGFYASIAGVLFAHFYCGITPGDFSIVKSITIMTMVVIGGSSSIYGAVIGTAFLTAVTYSLEYISDLMRGFGVQLTLMDYNIFIYGSIFLIILLFLPDGIISLKEKINIRRFAGIAKR